MSDALSFVEIDGQHVELLPARTVMSMFHAGGNGGSGGSGVASAGDQSAVAPIAMPTDKTKLFIPFILQPALLKDFIIKGGRLLRADIRPDRQRMRRNSSRHTRNAMRASRRQPLLERSLPRKTR